MDVIFLIIACLLFFTYSSIVTSRFILMMKELQMTAIQTIIIVIFGHIGYFLGVSLYDIAKKFNIYKFFIGGSILFACLQILLNYSYGDFKTISITSFLLFCSWNLVDLCCNMLSRYIPGMFSVFLRNLGGLIASIINIRINYVGGIKGKNLVLYLCCSSILSFLMTNINIKFIPNRNNAVSMMDIFVLYKEYASVFWSFICVNLIDILLLKYLVYLLSLINGNEQYGRMLEMSFYLGRLILHYPIISIMSYFKSKAKIIIIQILNMILLMILPILYIYQYVNTSIIIIFILGATSLLRHGIAMYFNEILQERHKSILLDIALNKIRSICLLLAFLIEVIFIAGWNLGAYIILLIFQIISIGSFIMM